MIQTDSGKTARIGVFGSAFDPINNNHLYLSNKAITRKRLDGVIFCPSSRHRSDKYITTSDEDRLNMIRLAIEGNYKFSIDDDELKASPGEYHTFYTMRRLKNKHKDDTLFFIMGSDILRDLPDWVYGRELIEENRFIVFGRRDYDPLQIMEKSPLLRNYDDGRFELIGDDTMAEGKSSYIREEFLNGGDPRYLLPEPCYRYIIEHGLYRRRDGK